MSNWAINRYSFQIIIIGRPKRKQNEYSASRPSSLNPAISFGDVNQHFILSGLSAFWLKCYQKGYWDHEVNHSAVVLQRVGIKAQGHPEGHHFSGCAGSVGRYGEPA